MREFFEASVFAGVFITLAAYFIGVEVKKRTGSSVFNPILVGVIITIVLLKALGIDYQVYNAGAKYISFFLTPATVCLAIPMYEQIEPLKKNFKAIIIGITSGVLTSLITIFALALIFGLDHTGYVSLLPKSITTAIGMSVSEELGGIVSITVMAIIITGILGNVIAEGLLKICRIEEPVAKGVAIGSASHAVGTAKAMELGETEGAMSSLSIVIAGVLTVFGAMIFSRFI